MSGADPNTHDFGSDPLAGCLPPSRERFQDLERFDPFSMPPPPAPKAPVDLPGEAVIKDSGKREGFETGSVRDSREGKGRFDLVSPIALRIIARHYEEGAKKYGERNWEKGQPVTRYLDSAMRHLNCHLLGMRDEPHISSAIWNLLAILHTEHQVANGKLPQELIDWPESYV